MDLDEEDRRRSDDDNDGIPDVSDTVLYTPNKDQENSTMWR